MLKHVERFHVTLDRRTLLPGDILRGSVSFILRQPINAKSLAINFQGEGLAEATQVKNKKCTRQFMYLDNKVAVFDKSKAEGLAAFQTPGKHTFFFRHRLPRNLPGSFSYSAADHDASISYCIYAVLKTPKRFGCKQTTTRAEVKILKTRNDYDEDFDFDQIHSDGKVACTYKYVPLDELEETNLAEHRKVERVVTQAIPAKSTDRVMRSSSQSSCQSTTDSETDFVTGDRRTSEISNDSALGSSYDSHSDVMSLGSMGSAHSRLSSQSSESDAFDRSRHTSVDDSGLDENVQEYIVKVLQAGNFNKDAGDVTSSVEQMNISHGGGRRNSLFKTVIVM